MLQNYSDINKVFPGLRKEYRFGTLEREDLVANPFEQFGRWLTQAVEAGVPKPDAMVLSTASGSGKPSSRIMLLKGFSEEGFVFYTNYESPKAKDLTENPRAALLFFWPQKERKIRIEGRVKRLSAKESEAYFRTRPRESQLASWISRQSRVVAERKDLETKLETIRKKFDGRDVPRPPFWGGYRVIPSLFEFWQGRENRLNDRFRYRKTAQGWKTDRLQP